MKLLLTLRAQREFHSIKRYVESEWGEIASRTFERKANELFDIMEQYPRIGKSVDEGLSIRGVQLTHHIRVYYRIHDQEIIVLTLFDVRQDPTKSPS